MIKSNMTLKLAVATVVALTAAVGALGLTLPAPQRAFAGPRPWLNTSPLRPEELRGKVVLVNFWTYSCVNSARALPYVKAWAEKYKDQGLVVIGVHTPEFAFEKDIANVRQATAAARIGYPVVLDNDFEIWRAFGNEAWPAFYFIDADGRVRRSILGEGRYDQSEWLIQKLLSEANGTPVSRQIVDIIGEGAQAPPDDRDLASPETFIGYARARGFASADGTKEDASSRYAIPASLALNTWALAGDWAVGEEFATATSASSHIAYRFHARDLHLVMGPPARGPVRFRVTLDGQAPGPDHGVDVDAEGWGRIDKPRMYQLIRQSESIQDRTFAIEFFESDVRAYDFTFG
jgi:thiol-disulfide isomerase/thioredoxin